MQKEFSKTTLNSIILVRKIWNQFDWEGMRVVSYAIIQLCNRNGANECIFEVKRINALIKYIFYFISNIFYFRTRINFQYHKKFLYSPCKLYIQTYVCMYMFSLVYAREWKKFNI